MRLLKRFFMRRIDSIEKLAEIGKRVLKENLDYKVYLDKDDERFEIYRGEEKIYEFLCNKEIAHVFFHEAVNF